MAGLCVGVWESSSDTTGLEVDNVDGDFGEVVGVPVGLDEVSRNVFGTGVGPCEPVDIENGFKVGTCVGYSNRVGEDVCEGGIEDTTGISVGRLPGC